MGAGEDTIRADQDFYRCFIFWLIFKCIYYQNESKFSAIYSRNNLPKIKYGPHLINLGKYKSVGTHWIAWYVNGNNVPYFDSYGVDHIPKEIKKLMCIRNIKTRIYWIQANDSIMCGNFCIGFKDFMVKGKSFLDYTNLFSPTKYQKIK